MSKRFSSDEHKTLSGSLYTFNILMSMSLDRLVGLASDKEEADEIRKHILDLFDRMAGELNGPLVTDIKRNGKLRVSNGSKQQAREQSDQAIRDLHDKLIKKGILKHKILNIIKAETGFKETKIRTALKS